MTDLLQALPLSEATVVAVPEAGPVTVHTDDDVAVDCRLLQTSDVASLTLHVGDRVLAVVLGEAGYILGRVAPAARPARVVEVVVPEGVETVRLTGKRVRIAADEELTLECAGGAVRIDKRGKVVVLGTEITSRAKRTHKIKGASVAIN